MCDQEDDDDGKLIEFYVFTQTGYGAYPPGLYLTGDRSMSLRNEIEAAIRRVQAAQDRLTAAEIDYGCTRSQIDLGLRTVASAKCEDEVDKAVNAILALIANEIKRTDRVSPRLW